MFKIFFGRFIGPCLLGSTKTKLLFFFTELSSQIKHKTKARRDIKKSTKILKAYNSHLTYITIIKYKGFVLDGRKLKDRLWIFSNKRIQNWKNKSEIIQWYKLQWFYDVISQNRNKNWNPNVFLFRIILICFWLLAKYKT